MQSLIRSIFAKLSGKPTKATSTFVAPSEQAPILMVLTGAGISAESGIQTYRGPGGTWIANEPDKFSTAKAIADDPVGVSQFFDRRREEMARAKPNDAHFAIAELGRSWPGPMFLTTTNVDDLHERAGYEPVHHLHGSLLRVRCTTCGTVRSEPLGGLSEMQCRKCRNTGSMRPDVTLFGERPQGVEDVMAMTDHCDVFLAIGCGGTVTPANLLPGMATRNCNRDFRGGRGTCDVVEINIVPTGNCAFNEVITGLASVEVRRWMGRKLSDIGRFPRSTRQAGPF